MMDDALEKRLERIEEKLDKLANVLVDVGVVEQRIKTVEYSNRELANGLRRTDTAFDDLKEKINKLDTTFSTICKLFFGVITIATTLIAALLGGWIV